MASGPRRCTASLSYVVLYSTYLRRTACYCMTVAWHRQKPALAVVSCMRLFPTTLVNNASFRTWQSQTWASIHTQLGLKISSTAGRLFPPKDERIGRGDNWEPARSHWGEWLFTRLLTFLRLVGAPCRHVVFSNFPCLPSAPVYHSLEFPLLTSTTPLTSPESGDDAQGQEIGVEKPLMSLNEHFALAPMLCTMSGSPRSSSFTDLEDGSDQGHA